MIAKTSADGTIEVAYDLMHFNHSVEMKHSQLNDDEKAVILGNYFNISFLFTPLFITYLY